MSGGKKQKQTKPKAWVVTVNMGYGHQRATHPLRSMAQKGEIIVANNYEGIPRRDRRLWHDSRVLYETISRLKRVPLIGEKIFRVMDRMQAIPWFYPRRDLSAPNFQVKQYYWFMKHRGWGKHLIEYLNTERLPMVTSFPVTAFMAEFFGFKGGIYLIVTDTDISRAWAGLEPKKSRVNYFASNTRVVERLKLYGVRPNKIYMTGFPLSKENLGGPSLGVVKRDLAQRLYNLDPKRNYISKYRHTIQYHLGAKCFPCRAPRRPLTITFAVGGAGAQRKLGIDIVRCLKKRISRGQVKVNLVAGARNDVYRFFHERLVQSTFHRQIGKGVEIIYDKDKIKYFDKFNKLLRATDILWTKPSELSFYAGLGIPILIAPPIGSQEFFNRIWLKSMGAGMSQYPPAYVDEWLFDWLDSGWFAKAAMQGFLEAPKLGTYNIEEVIFKKHVLRKPKVVLQY
ncbi:hypothetical protein KJ969_02640 [Patescibacteria group bacterium]|nr:hypothetical protein [Patescibacteria group bacterium]MBU1922365.1 hypothetical protein [Patescibacteria group bacterium]